MGTLFVVATPIGNLGDLSSRAIETLGSCDLIVAEDTRHTGKLLHRLGIDAQMISFNEHNVSQRMEPILASLAAGDVCLVTDAGTPAVSDPGHLLVAAAHEASFPVRAVPGPSAVVAALSVAGMPATPFTFHGYAPRGAGELRTWFGQWRGRRETQVFFESPNRIARSMETLVDALPHADVAIVRELTKVHEQVVRGRATVISQQLTSGEIATRGEFVVVVRVPELEGELDPMTVLAELLQEGASPNQAARTVAELTGLPKSDLYRMAVEQRNAIRSGTRASGDA
jgi:16S rRNA (cytidine1402-2'-O)-methyltransferase